MSARGIGFRIMTLAFGLCLALPVASRADTYYSAAIDGPSAGTPSPATGTATLILNSAETEVAYFIEFSGLLGNETLAHIHNSPPGVVGPVFHGLALGSPKEGIWEVGPFEVAELNAGRVNILIHSEVNLGGEIRGDVAFDFVSGQETQDGEAVPAGLVVRGAYPNPFNPATTISYGVPRDGRVTVRVFDARGRLVRRLRDEFQPAGYHTAPWDGTDDAGARAPSGVYLCRISAGGRTETAKMSLVQ